MCFCLIGETLSGHEIQKRSVTIGYPDSESPCIEHWNIIYRPLEVPKIKNIKVKKNTRDWGRGTWLRFIISSFLSFFIAMIGDAGSFFLRQSRTWGERIVSSLCFHVGCIGRWGAGLKPTEREKCVNLGHTLNLVFRYCKPPSPTIRTRCLWVGDIHCCQGLLLVAGCRGGSPKLILGHLWRR